MFGSASPNPHPNPNPTLSPNPNPNPNPNQGIEAPPHTASPRLMAVSVSSGPAAGATRVFITGVSLRGGDDYRCRFGGLITPAVYESDGAQPDGSACLGLGLP